MALGERRLAVGGGDDGKGGGTAVAADDRRQHGFDIVAVGIAALAPPVAQGGLPPRCMGGARHRSEERRVGKVCVSTCSSRSSPYPEKQNIHPTKHQDENTATKTQH